MDYYVQAQSGPWADGATWGNASPGVEGTDYPYYSAYQATVQQHITVSSGMTLTTSGNLYLGGNSSNPCYLVLEPGSTITDGGAGHILYRANLSIVSTATSANWATWGGALKLYHADSVYGYSRMLKLETDVPYVSFQTTADLYFGTGFQFGTLTAKLNIQHSTFVGCGTVTFGYGGYNTVYSTTVDYCDFRGCSLVKFFAGDVDGINTFTHNTLDDCVLYQEANLTNIDYTGTVWNDTQANFVTGTTEIANIFFSKMYGNFRPAGHQDLVQRIVDSVLLSVGPISWHGAESISVCDSVVECRDDAEPNLLFAWDGSTYRGNLIVGNASGAFNRTVTGALTSDTDIAHNTVVIESVPHPHDGMYLQENSDTTENGGGLVFKDNLIGFYTATNESFYHDNSDGQVIKALTKNAYFNSTASSKLDNCTVTTDTDFNDVGTSFDPGFVDSTRTVASYGATIGADGSYQGAVDQFLAINGYNGTTQTQSATPSAADIADLIDYMRAGFVPTNSALQGAASDGGDIGALAVAVAANTATVSLDVADILMGILADANAANGGAVLAALEDIALAMAADANAANGAAVSGSLEDILLDVTAAANPANGASVTLALEDLALDVTADSNPPATGNVAVVLAALEDIVLAVTGNVNAPNTAVAELGAEDLTMAVAADVNAANTGSAALALEDLAVVITVLSGDAPYAPVVRHIRLTGIRQLNLQLIGRLEGDA